MNEIQGATVFDAGAGYEGSWSYADKVIAFHEETKPFGKWYCDLYGNGEVVIQPKEGAGPNWIQRYFQELVFGVKWKRHQ